MGGRSSSKPIVAIVGRPNVGKSTLFNRLLQRPIAITEDLPGTTRDRVSAEMMWKGRSFTLVDTGGLDVRAALGLPRQVKEQVEVAIRQATVVLFLLDVVDGLMPPDFEIADLVRRADKPVFLVVNKVDNSQRARDVVPFHELGFGEPLLVSAYHGLGIDELLDALVDVLPPEGLEEETDGNIVLRVAIMGRPNVGKSLLLNAILGEERAIVSETPGTTRDALDTLFTWGSERLLFIDTAGIRRRGRVKAGVEFYSVLRAQRALERADLGLLLVDATEGVTAQDMHIAGYVWEAYKSLVIVVNKWDRAESLGLEKKKVQQEVEQAFRFTGGVPVVFVSAKEGWGVAQVLETVVQVGKGRLLRLPTAVVNDIMGQAVVSHYPPSVKGRRLKTLYATQTEVNPPTFVIFVNDATLVVPSYQRYLENCLRRAHGFEGTPLRFVFRSRREAKGG